METEVIIRLAIIDHETHQLYIEDVSETKINEYGGEQEYIDANYKFTGNYSWDYIVFTEYYPLGSTKPVVFSDSNPFVKNS